MHIRHAQFNRKSAICGLQIGSFDLSRVVRSRPLAKGTKTLGTRVSFRVVATDLGACVSGSIFTFSMTVRSRGLRRLLKRLIIVLSCSSVFYLAFISFKKKGVILTSVYGGYFTDEIQKPSDAPEVQLAVSDHSPDSRVKDTEKVQQSNASLKNLPLSFNWNDSVIFTSESGRNFTDEELNSTDTCEEGDKGQLTVSVWRDLCGDEVKALRNSPFYPSYPSERKIIREFTQFQVEDSKTEYGQTIVGFLNPTRSGSYRFAIASDDSSELWLSPSENPDKKRLIASVFVEGATGWTGKNVLNKYPNQISREIKLRDGGRYYIEVIHKQGEGAGFVQVFWSNPGVTDFQLISSEYLSSCSLSPKQDAMNQLLAKRLAISQTAWKKFISFNTLPLIGERNFLPQCAYKSSFIPKDKIDQKHGLSLVSLSSVFPQDDTFMGSKGNVWSWSNRAADREIVQSVVDKMIASLSEKTAK